MIECFLRTFEEPVQELGAAWERNDFLELGLGSGDNVFEVLLEDEDVKLEARCPMDVHGADVACA